MIGILLLLLLPLLVRIHVEARNINHPIGSLTTTNTTTLPGRFWRRCGRRRHPPCPTSRTGSASWDASPPSLRRCTGTTSWASAAAQRPRQPLVLPSLRVTSKAAEIGAGSPFRGFHRHRRRHISSSSTTANRHPCSTDAATIFRRRPVQRCTMWMTRNSTKTTKVGTMICTRPHPKTAATATPTAVEWTPTRSSTHSNRRRHQQQRQWGRATGPVGGGSVPDLDGAAPAAPVWHLRALPPRFGAVAATGQEPRQVLHPHAL
jgi:hypothetical protein